MNLNQYQDSAWVTATFPSGYPIPYLALALCGEAGEAADKVKKVVRDYNGIFFKKDRYEIALELGDVLWYLAVLAELLGYNLEDIAQMNLRKIEERMNNGTLHGSGDHR